jgi:hypothetical protein
MRWDKKSLNKIATYFENKIRKEGWESYSKFLREKEIIEFSDIIECINNKEDGSIVVKRNAVYSYDHFYTSPTPLPNTSSSTNNPVTISISGFSNNNKINNTSNISNISNTSASNSNLSTLNNNNYSSNCSNITLSTSTNTNTNTIPIYNLGTSNTGYTISTNDVNLYQDENLYLLVPKKLAEKIFLLESI